jgi:hypothetical protein
MQQENRKRCHATGKQGRSAMECYDNVRSVPDSAEAKKRLSTTIAERKKKLASGGGFVCCAEILEAVSTPRCRSSGSHIGWLRACAG